MYFSYQIKAAIWNTLLYLPVQLLYNNKDNLIYSFQYSVLKGRLFIA